MADRHMPTGAARSPLDTLTAPIELRQVVFRYGPDLEPVLRGIDMSIEPGQIIGFVGTSGAGKTTLIDLITGLIKPSEGDILVNNQPIDELGGSWQRSIGYIPQSAYLCDDTIRRNIAFGLEDDQISEQRVTEVVSDASLSEFVDSLPEGLDTLVGEHGVRTSGGQRQRLGIARALYHSPLVLVLDEATSALDNRTEREISDTIAGLSGDKTVLIIAHRLTTVRHCDQIVFLKQGRILDRGTYEELLSRNNDFRDLVTAWQPRRTTIVRAFRDASARRRRSQRDEQHMPEIL